MLFEPFYPYHLSQIRDIGLSALVVPLQPPNWAVDWERLGKAISKKTKAVLINTPSNPAGKIFSMGELSGLARIAIKHNLTVISDEVYEHFTYGGKAHISPGSLPQMAENCVTISSFSKTFHVTGWRVGYSVSREDWASRIGAANDLLYACAPAPLQVGAARGLQQLPPSFYRGLMLEFQAKRDRLCAALRAAGLAPITPEGSYYVLADASGLGGNGSFEKALYLLSNAGVSSVPGRSFFGRGGGENLLRFCFAKKDAELEEACRRLEKFGGKA